MLCGSKESASIMGWDLPPSRNKRNGLAQWPRKERMEDIDQGGFMTTTKRGFMTDLEKETRSNADFRRVLYTGRFSQLVLMNLKPNEEIGEEVHDTVDQFFRFEEGEGIVVIDGVKHRVRDGSGVIVPSRARHNVINTSSKMDLKLYTIYSPPEHQDKVVRHTKADAVKQPEEYDGKPTE